MDLFLRIFKHLLPRARAWNITISKKLREFFQGLSGLGDEIKLHFDLIWLDVFPDTTRQLSEWEKQFALSNTLTVESERRERLKGRWRAIGGQSPRYIQDVLQSSGFDVYVHEWWIPASNPPTIRNPHTYLDDGTRPGYWSTTCGSINSHAGNPVATCGAQLDPSTFGYVLVNKLPIEYTIPFDPDLFPGFIYIGAETFPQKASISAVRKGEFETLLLKICPAHLWLGILVDYT